MKTVSVTIEIPTQMIADQIVPLIVDALLRQDQERMGSNSRKRTPADALLKAVEETAAAVSNFENHEFTRAERDASARVISAAKGLRKALKAQKIEEAYNAN